MEAPRKDTFDLNAFVRKVWSEGKKHHRDFAWRYIGDAYAVLVSEIMLQQTQVSRVEKYWPRFLKTFPTLDALASADTSLVLEHWQGLGYNRRALARSSELLKSVHFDSKGSCPEPMMSF